MGGRLGVGTKGATYRSLVGSLVWFTQTRWDIAHDVNRLSQWLSAPTKGAMKALRRVVAYLASTIDFKLEVPRVTNNTWHIYSDSDHAGDKESGKHQVAVRRPDVVPDVHFSVIMPNLSTVT